MEAHTVVTAAVDMVEVMEEDMEEVVTEAVMAEVTVVEMVTVEVMVVMTVDMVAGTELGMVGIDTTDTAGVVAGAMAVAKSQYHFSHPIRFVICPGVVIAGKPGEFVMIHYALIE